MSVAFRRESDEAHLEPRFDRPVPPGPNPVTARGLALLQARVDALEVQLRTDLDEGERAEATRDLRYWRQRLATAEPVVATAAAGGGTVAFGSHVRLRHDGREREVRLVGHDEAAETDGMLGVASPLGRALIGAEAGDLVAFGGREEALAVLAVSAG